MTDMIDLSTALFMSSPVVVAWPATRRITHVHCDARGGFVLTFDQPLPDSWKWKSNPDVPTDNVQFTVWAVVKVSGVWIAAGFVEMWQGRPMGDGSLPAIFAVNGGAPGYTNWWGDVRRLWGSMSLYVPQPGDQIGLMVSAGNGRLRSDVTSVAERSNVVVVTLAADDALDVDYQADGAPPVPSPVPQPPTPTPAPVPGKPPDEILAEFLADVERLVSAIDVLATNVSEMNRRLDGVQVNGIKVHI